MRIYLTTLCPAKFHQDPFLNDGALGFSPQQEQDE